MEKLEIDKKRLHDDLVMLRDYYSNVTYDKRYADDYYCFMELVKLYEVLMLKEFPYDRIKILEGVVDSDEYYAASLKKEIKENFDKISKLFSNFNSRIENQIDPIRLRDNHDKLSKYKVSEVRDIMIDYYRLYGEKEEKFVRNYFDEKRIQVGAPLLDSEGEHISTMYGNVSYILLSFNRHNEFDSYLFTVLAHELGHAIDSSLAFSKYKTSEEKSPVLEIPSEFFEIGLLRFLKENKIDEVGADILKQVILNDVIGSSTNIDLVKRKYKKGRNIDIVDGNSVKLDDGRIIPVFSDMLYGFGQYMGLYLDNMLDGNYKDFMKRFYYFMRKKETMTIDEVIESLGIDKDDFMFGGTLAQTLIEENKVLSKKL